MIICDCLLVRFNHLFLSTKMQAEIVGAFSVLEWNFRHTWKGRDAGNFTILRRAVQLRCSNPPSNP